MQSGTRRGEGGRGGMEGGRRWIEDKEKQQQILKALHDDPGVVTLVVTSRERRWSAGTSGISNTRTLTNMSNLRHVPKGAWALCSELHVDGESGGRLIWMLA